MCLRSSLGEGKPMKLPFLNKKGQAVTFESAPSMVLILVVLALVAATGATGLTSFKQSQCGGFYNSTTNECYNNASQNALAGNFAVNTTIQGENSLVNFAIQLPTVGTMLGVGLILAVIFGVAGFFKGERKFEDD